jgi:3-oxoadipate enol-lactonase
MPKTHANGIDIYHESQGTGDPILLIAGFACDHTLWGTVVPALAAKHRVISFDNRGVGQSSGADSAVSVRQMAADTAALLDALELGSVHVAGHSMGGLIAQELALAHPQKIRSLMLLSTCAQVDERGKAIIESWGDLPRLVDPMTATRLILPWLYTNAFYARPGAIEQIIDLVLANPFPPTLAAMYGQSRAISVCSTTDRLSDLNCPTQVLVGREDILIPVAFSERLANGIREAELVILEKTGHGLLIESPDAVANAMLEFLSRQSA